LIHHNSKDILPLSILKGDLDFIHHIFILKLFVVSFSIVVVVLVKFKAFHLFNILSENCQDSSFMLDIFLDIGVHIIHLLSSVIDDIFSFILHSSLLLAYLSSHSDIGFFKSIFTVFNISESLGSVSSILQELSSQLLHVVSQFHQLHTFIQS
jgi:hypothetical protein